MQSDLLSGGLETHFFSILEEEKLAEMLLVAKKGSDEQIV